MLHLIFTQQAHVIGKNSLGKSAQIVFVTALEVPNCLLVRNSHGISVLLGSDGFKCLKAEELPLTPPAGVKGLKMASKMVVALDEGIQVSHDMFVVISPLGYLGIRVKFTLTPDPRPMMNPSGVGSQGIVIRMGWSI